MADIPSRPPQERAFFSLTGAFCSWPVSPGASGGFNHNEAQSAERRGGEAVFPPGAAGDERGPPSERGNF